MTGTDGAHVIVVGNEKGGSGKSTIALHTAVGLMQLGFQVVVADCDERQRSLLRYLENRRIWSLGAAADIPCPEIYQLPPPAADPSAERGRLERIDGELQAAARHADFLIIDTPGAATGLGRLVHGFADTLITPMNDSLIDLDVLARIAPGSMAALGPSHYSILVLEERRRRQKALDAMTDWIVVRNRVAPIASANNERVGTVLEALAPKLGFRLAPGILERVIYRELFLTGATVLDSIELIAGTRLTMSHVAARIEMRQLFDALCIPQVTREIAADRSRSIHVGERMLHG